MPLRLDGTIARDGVKRDEDFIWFRGGASVIIDPRKGREEIRYSIIKNTGSAERQQAPGADGERELPVAAAGAVFRRQDVRAVRPAARRPWRQTTMAKKSRKQKKAKQAAVAAAPGAAAATATPAVTVRHYCQGIGDCHLLSFPKADGTLSGC